MRNSHSYVQRIRNAFYHNSIILVFSGLVIVTHISTYYEKPKSLRLIILQETPIESIEGLNKKSRKVRN